MGSPRAEAGHQLDAGSARARRRRSSPEADRSHRPRRRSEPDRRPILDQPGDGARHRGRTGAGETGSDHRIEEGAGLEPAPSDTLLEAAALEDVGRILLGWGSVGRWSYRGQSTAGQRGSAGPLDKDRIESAADRE